MYTMINNNVHIVVIIIIIIMYVYICAVIIIVKYIIQKSQVHYIEESGTLYRYFLCGARFRVYMSAFNMCI